ncbi:DJ-1/PfpI family protein [Vibrio sp. SCSIO 43137]|uniref:DJ-1/PfpI family protein n=1 Tax=Vibrio sp. SCSIO 43137 TaxID=3021011 RepID=UPI002307B014|nr:DJ-1/PfpI family protein [Vibrio sp. SCSIO 43137]WCE32683.1 DJ-1/PfpI family protein [Vibrio sp. SCSIO 43137]
MGYLLTPGCNTSDIVNSEAVFRFHPLNKIYYVSERTEAVQGRNGLTLLANSTPETCPQLDVLIVPGSSRNKPLNKSYNTFIKKQTAGARFTVGVSEGVVQLYQAGIITHQQVTADSASTAFLQQQQINSVYTKQVILDGKLVTAGPSTGAIDAAFTILEQLHGRWITRLAEFTLEYDAPVQFAKTQQSPLKIPPKPKPLNIGVFVPSGIYLPDVIGATDVFSSLPNSKLYFLSDRKQQSKPILGFGPTLMPSTTYEECPPLDVLIVGATHPKYLNDQQVIDFVLRQDKCASAIVSVCAGTFLISSTGLLKGKTATTNYHQISALSEIGVIADGSKLAEDGKFFSAGPAVGSYAVALRAVQKIAGSEWAQYIEQELLEFNPNPIYRVTPDNAGWRIHILSNLLSFVANKLYTAALKRKTTNPSQINN